MWKRLQKGSLNTNSDSLQDPFLHEGIRDATFPRLQGSTFVIDPIE